MAHGRYTIVGKLADGGMAEIFLAVQKGAEGFQKRVVLKRVLTAFSADQQFRNMFLDEAHISMSLAHGNIVQVLDVGVAGERTFLVLELVEGWNLEQILERAQATGPEHPWPPSLALYVTVEVCRGLAYAHAKHGLDGRPLGIVHRDVSPNNVLISEHGDVKLADFGIAKAESKREQTMAGVIKGKIGFMSPEQALGRPLDARADLFSVGTVMYLMLTGRRPFEAGSELESMMLAQRAEYHPPENLNPYLSPEATAIVTRAMQREPADRYQTADEMLADVERVLRSQYNSAGQTELKLWLAELARRDGAAPMGRLPVVEDDSARPVFVDEAGELSAGSSVELSDIDGSAGPTAVGMSPIPGTPATTDASASSSPALAKTVSATPVSAPSPSTPLSSPQVRSGAEAAAASQPIAGLTPSPGPPAKTLLTNRRLPRRSRVGLGFLLGAVCMLGAVFGIKWLAEWAGRERLGIPAWARGHLDSISTAQPPVVPVVPPAAPVAGAVPVAAAAAHSGSAATVVADAGGRQASPEWAAAAVPGSPPDANANTNAGTNTNAAERPVDRRVATTDVEAPTGVGPATGDMDDDEDRLLGRMVPDAATVIGEDDAEDSSRSKRAKAAGKDQPADSKKGGHSSRPADADKHTASATRPQTAQAQAQRPQPVQIRITTSPLGAVVRTKKRVLGRTPLALRFNPGNTYELTFVKRGYVTNSRSVSVASGKPQSISVAMKRAPAPPRRTGFLRGR